MVVRNKTDFIANEVYYITFTILGWKEIFINDKYCDLVYKWFDYAKDKYGNKIYGYVIMPNHLHTLMHITNNSPKLSVLIQNAKRFMAYEIINILEAERRGVLLEYFKIKPNQQKARHEIFQPRYDSLLIQTEKMFLQKLNYIHNNPCQEKWGLADKPEDYQYSSAANYIKDSGVYQVDIVDF